MSILLRSGLAGWMALATVAYAGGSAVDTLITKEFVSQQARINRLYRSLAEDQRRALWQKTMGDYLEQLSREDLVTNYLVAALPASAVTSFTSSVQAHSLSYASASSSVAGAAEPTKVVIHYQEHSGEEFKTLEFKP